MGDKDPTATKVELGGPRTVATGKGRSVKQTDPDTFDPEQTPEPEVKVRRPRTKGPAGTSPAVIKRGSGPGGSGPKGNPHNRRPQSPAQRAATMKNLKKAQAALKARQG